MNQYAIKHPNENKWACLRQARVGLKTVVGSPETTKDALLFYRWRDDIYDNEVVKFASQEEAHQTLQAMWEIHEKWEIKTYPSGQQVSGDFKRIAVLNNEWKNWGTEILAKEIIEVPKVSLPYFHFDGQIVAMDIQRGIFYNGQGMGTQSDGFFCAPTIEAIQTNIASLREVLWQHAKVEIGHLIFLETCKDLPAKPVGKKFTGTSGYLDAEYERLEHDWYQQKEEKLRNHSHDGHERLGYDLNQENQLGTIKPKI